MAVAEQHWVCACSGRADCSGGVDCTHFCCRTGPGGSSIHADFCGCNLFLLARIPLVEILSFQIPQFHELLCN